MKEIKQINPIYEILEEIGGKETPRLVDYISSKINVSEFKIAEKLGMTVNQVRNVLYKLGSYNLVYSTRKKDKKKGWYIYYWTYNLNQAQIVINNFKQKKIERLKKRIDEESNTSFFMCQHKHHRYNYNTALENSFKCLECGEILKEQQTTKELNELKKKLQLFESQI